MGDLQGSGASANWPRHVNAAEKRRKRDGGLARESRKKSLLIQVLGFFVICPDGGFFRCSHTKMIPESDMNHIST